LEYIDDKEGNGVVPKSGQTCHVHYTGWLWTNGAKGRKFDSSVDTGQPIPFRLGKGEVIEGWDEGIATMKVGGKRRLLIPPKLGYGRNGNPPEIPGNADLLFEVELVKVK
jgi:peptidylprolyl isomerase